MNNFFSLILGGVEGVTEFLPISSTAHLIIVSHLLSLHQTDFLKMFEVVIQTGAILAVIVKFGYLMKKNRNLIINLSFSFFPTAFVGFVLYKIIKNVLFDNLGVIFFSLLVGGVVFLIIEFLIKREKIILNKKLRNLNWRDAVVIGLFQSLAVVPGVSRAGAVIVGMLLLGYKRGDSVLYSFLLAVPTIIAAGAFDLLKTGVVLSHSQIVFLGIGLFSSYIFAIFSINWFISYLKKNDFIVFGLYRIALGVIGLLAL